MRIKINAVFHMSCISGHGVFHMSCISGHGVFHMSCISGHGVLLFCAVVWRIASNAGVPGGNYFILLILTDGIITDMQQTCESIVNVSNACRTLLLVLVLFL